MLAAKLGSLRCALSSEGGPNQSWRPTPGSGAAALIVSRMWRLLFKPICLPWFPAPKPKEETATDRSMNNLGSWLHLSPRDIVFRLAVLAAINVVVFWVPAFYARKYGADAFGTICFAVILCPLSWVLAGLSYPQAWRGSAAIPLPKAGLPRIVYRAVATALALVVFSTFFLLVIGIIKAAREP